MDRVVCMDGLSARVARCDRAAKLVIEWEPRWLRHFHFVELDRKKIAALEALNVNFPSVWSAPLWGGQSPAARPIRGPEVLIRDFHFGRPGLAPYTPKTFCLDRFAVAAHWACPLNRQRAVREGLAEQTAVVLGRFFDTSPTLRPVVAHGLVTPSAVNRPVRAAPRSAGASPRTAAASDGSPPAGASSNERVSPAAHPS